jgi:hypothetical protein
VFNSLSTFGTMLILTYQLQSVMGYSALGTGLALVPFAIAAALAAAIIAPRLAAHVPPRWLTTATPWPWPGAPEILLIAALPVIALINARTLTRR